MKFRYIILIIISMLIVSCSSTNNIQTVHDTVTVNNYKNIYIHDSIFNDRVHYEYIKGDTLVIKDSIYIWKAKLVYDTIYKDSIIYKDRVDTKVITKNKYPIYPYIIFIGFLGACYIYFKYIRKKLLS